MRIANAPEVGDPEMQALQQARLLALGMRTMTLPLGRGALTLGDTTPPLPVNMLLLCSRSLGGEALPECCESVQAHCVPYPQSRCAYQICAWLVACPSSTTQSSTWTCRLPTLFRELLLMLQPGQNFTMELLLVCVERLCCSA